MTIEVLRRPGGRERTRLYRALSEFDPHELDEVIAGLEEAGVVRAGKRRIHATRALKRIEELGLIGV